MTNKRQQNHQIRRLAMCRKKSNILKGVEVVAVLFVSLMLILKKITTNKTPKSSQQRLGR